MDEGSFQTKVMWKLRSEGCKVFNIHGHAYQATGIPDLWVGHEKWQGWLELKAEKTAITPIQWMQIRKLSLVSHAFVVRWTPARIVWYNYEKEEIGEGWPTVSLLVSLCK